MFIFDTCIQVLIGDKDWEDQVSAIEHFSENKVHNGVDCLLFNALENLEKENDVVGILNSQISKLGEGGKK